MPGEFIARQGLISRGNVVVTGSLTTSGSLTTTGTITATTLVVQTITSSISSITGSTNFGSLSSDTHKFTGSLNVTGAFYVTTGSVGIGTVSPSQKLEVVGGEIKAGRVDSSQEGGQVSFGRASDNNTSWYIDLYGSSTSPQLRFVDVDNSAVRMTLTGSNVGIGTTNPLAPLSVNGSATISPAGSGISSRFTDGYWSTFYISHTTPGLVNLIADSPMVFYTGAGGGSVAERMRITSGGNVGIGVSPSAWGSGTTALQIGTAATLWNRASDNLLVLASNSYFDGSADKQITTNTSNRMYFVNGGTYFERAASTAAGSSTPWSSSMVISANGSIGAPTAGTNIYNASDIRLKQNISTITNGLSKINALNPVKFNWIHNFEPTENEKDLLGFIAQEVQNIIPEAVENFGNNSIIVGETVIENPLRVNEKFIIPVLVKAIQELTARVQYLENK